MSDETRCWIRETAQGYYWRVRWPNGGSISGTEETWKAAAVEIREQLHGSVYARRDDKIVSR